MAGISFHFEDSFSEISRVGDNGYPNIRKVLWNQFQDLPVSVIHIVVRCKGFKGTPGSSVHLNATRMLASMKTAKERWVKRPL